MPTMWSEAIQSSEIALGLLAKPFAAWVWLSANCQVLSAAFQCFIHVPHQIPHIVPAIQHVHHVVADFEALLLRAAVHRFVPLLPIRFEFREKRVMFPFQ